MIGLDTSYLEKFVDQHEFQALKPFISTASNMVKEKNGLGNDFLGWVDLPDNYNRDEFDRIKKAADRIKKTSDVLLVIGIGGSYLGSRAVIEAIKSPLYNNLEKDTPSIYFIGNGISSTYFSEIMSICKDKDVSVNVISKSGTTTEPALAFRIVKEFMYKKYGREEAIKRIYATTDKNKGTLKELSDGEGYETFVIPDDIGGRYSVLTPVGLLPIAVAGIDIDMLMKGASDSRIEYSNPDSDENICYKYAALRNIMLRKGKKIEVTEAYEPYMWCFGEWIKQLFGESEGKDGKGLFPASMIFSTDLHSLGQFVQQGDRSMFETVLWIQKPKYNITVSEEKDNSDGLNFLAGKTMHEVNEKAFQGTAMAHVSGGVPNIIINISEMNEYNMGYLIYFYEKACSISAYLLGVNPFDQPGVNMYKSNMFALLGKPGYEDKKAELENKITK